jgi:lysophospholipase L1-like esterase
MQLRSTRPIPRHTTLHILRKGAWAKTAVAMLTAFVALTVLAQASSAASHKKATMYYVSVGDSYSVGYQPGLGATTGYAGYVAKHERLTLVNFGCAGATTESVIDTIACPDNLPHTAGAHLYSQTTQAAAAEAFLTAHRGHIGLITVSIGGNDVTACGAQANPIPCVSTAVAGITQNVTSLAQGLRAAAGPKVPLIGLTYPDVLLGAYVYPALPATPASVALAQESVAAFKSLINPALVNAYAAAHGVLVDVTAATGAYTPLTTTTTLAPYGTLPVAVTKVCALTWYCKQGNIHATNKGYAFIGSLVASRFAAMHKA